MKKEEFILRVRTLAIQADYEENKHVLHSINRFQYDDFLYMLKMGIKMYPAFLALDKLWELSKTTVLSTMDILQLVPRFRFLISIFDLPC